MHFSLNTIAKKLGLTNENRLCIYSKNNPLIKNLPYRLQNSLEAIQPSACYFINKTPTILFFEVDDFTNFRQIHTKAWNLNSAPIFMLISNNEIRIHNSYVFNKDESKSLQDSLLDRISNHTDDIESKLSKYSYINIISNEYWKKEQKLFEKNTRVDQTLLRNIFEARRILVFSGLDESLSNTLIGRLLFVRYLIDRKVRLDEKFISFNSAKKDLLNLLNNKDCLYEFFAYLKEKFNGDMFPLNANEKRKVNESHLKILYHLFSGSELNYKEKYIQPTLFDTYDFSIIPIELISNIYETFLGKKVEKLEKEIFQTAQYDNKSFYTPPYLVDYILSNTINQFISNNHDKTICKVLDPSCGSGIFLVETLRALLSENYDKLYTDTGLDAEFIKSLVKDNIFGIDIDSKALDIAKFSIYITMLDYMNPKDISNFKFPSLTNNFFNEDFFNLSEKTEKTLKNKNIDFIIGNPPWGNTSDNANYYIDYCNMHNIPLSRKQIAQAFIFRARDFASVNTEIALIVTSKILYNIGQQAKSFRKLLLSTFKVKKIFDLTAIRHHVFLMTDSPATVIFYKLPSSNNINELLGNNIEYISPKPNILFKILKLIVVEKNDVKNVLQSKFLEQYGGYDWLWKTMLFGTSYDSMFIKRLRYDYHYTIDTHPDLEHNVGFQISGKDRLPTKEIKDLKFINTNKNRYPDYPSLFENFHINVEDAKSFQSIISKDYIHRTRDAKIYKGPHVLIKKGLKKSLTMDIAFCDEDVVFTDAVTSIRSISRNINLLKNIVALYNSDLFKYYLVMTGSSSGIERRQAHNKDDKFTFPLPDLSSDELSIIIDKLSHEIKTNIFPEYSSTKQLLAKLNEIVFNLYYVSNIEKDLIDYMKNVTLPMLQNDISYLRHPNNNEINAYVNILLDSMSFAIKKSNKFVVAKVYKTEWFVCVNFSITDIKPTKPIDYDNDSSKEFIIKKLGLYSLKKQTEDILFQRDIKGFQDDSYFILKPAEYKNWHTVLARIDSDEFMQEILYGNNNG